MTVETQIMGDLNCNVLGDAANRGSGKQLTQFCRNFQLTNLISGITRPSSGSLLDVILTTHPQRCAASTALPTGASDHSICTATLSMKAPRRPPRKSTFRCTKHTDVKALTDDLSSANWGSCYFDGSFEPTNANIAWDRWWSLLLPIVDRHIPLRHRTVKGDRPPWLTAEIEEAIRLRDKLSGLPQTTENRAAFRSQRNRVTAMKRKAMKTFFAQTATGPQSNPGKFHRRLQQATGLGRGRTGPPNVLASSDGGLLTEAPDICERFADHFGSCVPPSPVLSVQDTQNHISIRSIVSSQWPGFSFNFISAEQVTKTIGDLANNKAPGLDGITSKMMKICAPGLLLPLTDLFNHLINICQVPDVRKEAALTPFSKKGIRLTLVTIGQ